jgi:hypothetical protein
MREVMGEPTVADFEQSTAPSKIIPCPTNPLPEKFQRNFGNIPFFFGGFCL